MGSRRSFLTGAGASLSLAACDVQVEAPAPPQPAPREIPEGAWTPPAGALEMPGFAFWNAPAEMPAPLDAALLTLDGTTTLGALMAGRPAVLSFWAPWCAPCIAEKPSLDVLAGRLKAAGDRVAVLSIMVLTTQEPQTAETAAAHQRRMNLTNLMPLADAAPENSLLTAYIGSTAVRVMGVSVSGTSIPRSMLVDPNGRELGRLVNALRVTSPPGYEPIPGRKLDADDVADWPRQDLWREEAMFEFLSALGS